MPVKFEACKPRYVIHLVIISLTRDVYECNRSLRGKRRNIPDEVRVTGTLAEYRARNLRETSSEIE